MNPDPAASYRRRTPRQRAQAEARFHREAVKAQKQYVADCTAKALAANLQQQRKILEAAEGVLAKGTLKGVPLTPAKRREVADIARRARKAIGGAS